MAINTKYSIKQRQIARHIWRCNSLLKQDISLNRKAYLEMKLNFLKDKIGDVR